MFRNSAESKCFIVCVATCGSLCVCVSLRYPGSLSWPSTGTSGTMKDLLSDTLQEPCATRRCVFSLLSYFFKLFISLSLITGLKTRYELELSNMKESDRSNVIVFR